MAVDDTFLNRVGHDLRGELSTMVAGVHYVLRYEPSLGDAGRQMLERVNGAGKRMKQLLDEFELAAWISDTRKGPMVEGDIRLADLVDAAVVRLAPAATRGQVAVHVDLPDTLPDIEVDTELFGAAVEFMVDFAIARSPDGRVRVAAREERGALRLRVEDEGGAIEPEALVRVLDPFVEKEYLPRPEAGARRRERLGLGLSIARGIFAAHGGILTAELCSDPPGIALVGMLARP